MNRYACGILLENGRILLGKRASHRRAYANLWDVIGGKVEGGESVHQALVRELIEEIGIVPTACESLGSLMDSNPEARGESIYHMFVVTAWTGGAPFLRNDEHSALEWFAVEDACALPDLALSDYPAMFRTIAIRGLDRYSGAD